MEVLVTITKDELLELLGQLAPIRIHMTPTDEDRRWIELERPARVEFVERRGVRLTTRGMIAYDIAGVRATARVRELVVLLVPRVVQSGPEGHRLSFFVEIESGDLAKVPAIIDDRLVAIVNKALTPRATNMTWDFGATLSADFELPPRLEPLDDLEVEVSAGEARVESDRITFRVGLNTKLNRRKARPDDAERLERMHGAS